MKKRAPPQGPFTCYVLENGQRTYTGQTNNFARRLRQHRGELAGGARYTRRVRREHASQWKCMFRVCGFTELRTVLKFEYAMKHHKTRVSGPAGRVQQLERLLALDPPRFPIHKLSIQCHLDVDRYLRYAKLTTEEFVALRTEQGVEFVFT